MRSKRQRSYFFTAMKRIDLFRWKNEQKTRIHGVISTTENIRAPASKAWEPEKADVRN